MNHKITFAFFLFVAAALVVAFRGTPANENKTEVLASLVCSRPAAGEAAHGNDSLMTAAVDRVASNILLQSKDGGQTWEDISNGSPGAGLPEDFFAGEAGLYIRYKNEMYRSKSNLDAPVWEKDPTLDPSCTSIAFGSGGMIAYNADGKVFKRASAIQAWSPMFVALDTKSMRTIFETSDGTIFLGSDNGLFKSGDGGQTCRQVFNICPGTIVESGDILLATGQHVIMRSTDRGEHWEWVIKEGGTGIAIERVDDGFAAVVYSSSKHARRIYLSLNEGETWTAIDQGLSPSLSISSIKQVGPYLICGHPDGIFRSADKGKTWIIVHSSVNHLTPKYDDGKVYKLYVSGDVLYAVARHSGC